MDLAAKYDFVIEKGSTFERTIRWEDSAGAPKDISSYSLRMNITSFPTDVVLASTEGTSPKIVITKPEITGTFVITISSTNTGLLDFDTAMYTIEAYTSTTVERVMYGRVIFDRGI